MLVVVMSLAVILGLAASVPPTARAAANLTITIDPGATLDNDTLQELINQVDSYAFLTDALNRMVEEFYLNVPGLNETATVPYSGSLTITPDGTGVSMNITSAGDAAINPADPFWLSGAAAELLGQVAGMLLRSACEGFVLTLIPNTDLNTKLGKAFCALVGGSIGTMASGALDTAFTTGSFNGALAYPAASNAVFGGLFGSGFRELNFFKWMEDAVASLVNSFIVMAADTGLPPEIATDLRQVAGDLNDYGIYLINNQDSLLSYDPGVSSTSPPCDIYSYYGTPCADAYSTTRALYASYNGPLYELQRNNDGARSEIYPLYAGGPANAAEQDSFCAGATCTFLVIYDQSPNWNDLTVPATDRAAYAGSLPVQLDGSTVYGVDVTPGIGYRDNAAQNTATNGEPEGMYMVASGTNVNAGCCFDFGNAETNGEDNGPGHMDAVNLSTSCEFPPCAGGGPWVQADLENGLYQGGNGSNLANTGNSSNFVTAMLKNDGSTTFTLKGGDAQGGPLSTWWDGYLPTGYVPMKQEGAVIMGTGGDNSHSDYGSFFEGAMTDGYPVGAADTLVQENVVYAGYSGNSGAVAGLRPPAGTITMASGMCVDVLGDDTGGDFAPVDAWDCQPTAVDQHWTHNANGSLETLGLCLSISTAVGVAGQGVGAAGDHLVLYDCNGSGVEQWVQETDGALYNPPSGLCMYGQPSDGYQLQVVTCDLSDQDQQFSVNGGNPITNVPSGKCIDVLGDDTGTNGTPVDLWDCQQSAVDQHWTFANPNNTATGYLETLGRCLSISTSPGIGGTGEGALGNRVVLWTCNGSQVEEWTEEPGGLLENQPSGLCLYGEPTNGYQLLVTTCDGNDPDQQFASAGGGTGALGAPAGTVTMAGGMCVDVFGDDDGTDGTPVDAWDCQPYEVDQHWTHNADGSLETLGRCLDISTAQGVGGTGTGVPNDRVTLWDCNGSGVEEWMQQPNGTLENPPSGLCLYGQPSDGYQLEVEDCNASDPDQQFSVNGGNPLTYTESGQCIDVLGDDNGTDGTPVDLWDCQQGAADQHWVYNSSAETLETLGKCLDISVADGVGGTGTAVAGDHTTLWDCNGSGVEQWVPRPDGTLYNPPSGLCLDDPGGNTTNGWQLQVWTCTTGDVNQQFSIYNPGLELVNPVSSQCVDVLGDDTGGDGTPVDLWNCQPEAADQHWTYASDWTLQTLGKCLSISTAQGVGGTGTGVAGDHVVLWDCNGSSAEQWYPVDDVWLNPASELCLADPGGNTTNGWQLDIETCASASNETFDLIFP